MWTYCYRYLLALAIDNWIQLLSEILYISDNSTNMQQYIGLSINFHIVWFHKQKNGFCYLQKDEFLQYAF